MNAPSTPSRTWLRAALDVGACVALTLAALVGNRAHARERYELAVDPGSRHAFKHVLDRQTGLWVHLQCELRVPLARPLPDPLSTPDTGDLMSFTYFTSISMGSAGIVPAEFEEREGHRVWLHRELARPDDLAGRTSLGVQVSWPASGPGPQPSDPLEIFALPKLATLTPYLWTPWRRADEVRGGAFAGWAKLHGVESEPGAGPAREPFELRCRPVLADRLFTPLRADDANVGATALPPALAKR